jgi:pyridoxamine 5'-phosphate oxidase
MVKFINMSEEVPYKIFKNKYEDALRANQSIIEAICISSYSSTNKEVNSRFVNLKFVNDKEFIFFSNYESQKSNDFISHNQIAALFFWRSTNVQIRMKAKINKTSREFNLKYFSERDNKKNALAISSSQSKLISSYDKVYENYNKSLVNDNLKDCPEYWGGYSFIPYYFEFWGGHKSRLNKREVYEIKNGDWGHYILQP